MKVGHILYTKWSIPVAVPPSYCSLGLIPKGNSLTLPSLPALVPRSRLFCFRVFLLQCPSCLQRPLALDVIDLILSCHCEPCKRLRGKHFVRATSWDRVLVSLCPALCERCTCYFVAARSPLCSGKSHNFPLTL